MPPTFSTFGEMLKFLRRRARLTQKDLSIAVGYSESHISRLEGNERPPDAATLAARFLPALRLDKEPELAARLMELADTARGERLPQQPLLADASPHIEDPFPVPRHNLPASLTSFIGRARETFEGVQLSAEYRLVTLVGTGGCGKTRLALRIAEESLPTYVDGVWFVELAPLSVSALVPHTIATVLGLQEMRDRPLDKVLQEFLRPRQLLLILDNCEHLVAGVAGLVESLLRVSPGLHILTTSRETLNIAGEITFRVPPLRLPSLGWVQSLERVAEAEAVRLFIERARASSPSFTLTAQNASAVAQICARLDGIPLAIEMAAARVRHLPPEQIARRLKDRFSFLTQGSRDLPDRHRTLQAVLDWSYSLLAPDEQTLLNHLSVFSGSFSLEAVEGICGSPSGETLDLLSRLIDKSLVVAETEGGGLMRYRLLEIVRQYAQAKLREQGDESASRACHARFYLALAEAVEPRILSAERVKAIQEMEREYDDLRSALEWAKNAGELELAFQLAGALLWFWHFRGLFSEGRQLVEAILGTWEKDAPPDWTVPHAPLGKALWSAGILAWIQGDFPHAHARFETSIGVLRVAPNLTGEAQRILAHALSNLGLVVLDEGNQSRASALAAEAVALARKWGTPWDLALLLYNLGEVTYASGDNEAARLLLEESLKLFQRLGDRWGISIPTFLFGMMAGENGDYARARTYFEQALQSQRAEGELWGAIETMLLLGQAVHQLEDYPQARALYQESLQLNAERVGDIGIMLRTLYSFGHLAAAQAEPARAAQLFGAYHTLLEATDSPIRRSILNRDDQQTFSSLQGALGEESFKEAWAFGQGMTIAQATELALRG